MNIRHIILNKTSHAALGCRKSGIDKLLTILFYHGAQITQIEGKLASCVVFHFLVHLVTEQTRGHCKFTDFIQHHTTQSMMT